MVGQINQRTTAKQHRWQPLQQEQPLPPAEPLHAIQSKQRSRQGSADETSHGNRHHERAHRTRTMVAWIPVAQVIDYAREEAGFCNTQQEPENIELRWCTHEHHRGGDDSPAEHDSGDPSAGPDPMQYEIARDFKQAISEKEYAGTKPESGRAEFERIIHLQRGKSNVDTVE